MLAAPRQGCLKLLRFVVAWLPKLLLIQERECIGGGTVAQKADRLRKSRLAAALVADDRNETWIQFDNTRKPVLIELRSGLLHKLNLRHVLCWIPINPDGLHWSLAQKSTLRVTDKLLERAKARIALDPACRLYFVVSNVVVVRAHNERQDLPDGGEDDLFVALAVGQFADLIDVDTLAGQVRLQRHLEYRVVADILYRIALAAGVGGDNPAEVADQLCGLLEVNIDCLVCFLFDVLGSNFQLPAQLRPKFVQIDIFREDTNQVHLLLASEFGPELNPGKHREFVSRELLQRANTRNITWWSVIATALTPAFWSPSTICSFVTDAFL